MDEGEAEEGEGEAERAHMKKSAFNLRPPASREALPTPYRITFLHTTSST